MSIIEIQNNISEGVMSGNLSNDDLVQIIEHTGSYLNLKTVSDYSKSEGISYNGVKKCRTTRELFGVKFVIDNQ